MKKTKNVGISITLILIILGANQNSKISMQNSTINSNESSSNSSNNVDGDKSYTTKKSNSNNKSTSGNNSVNISSKAEVKSALSENLSLHTGYYLKEIYAEEKSFVTKGTNILKYTNGTYLTAPYDCYIEKLNLPETSGKCKNEHYVQIESKNMLSVTINVSEDYINNLSVGDEATVEIGSLSKTYTGYITHIASTAQNGKFEVTVEFENDDNVKIGMSATVKISK